MKPIPPTLRGKKRYIKFELLSDRQLDRRDVSLATIKNMQSLFGEHGLAEKRFKFMDFNEKTNSGIVFCDNNATEVIKASLLFLKTVGNMPVLPKIIAVSGSLNKLKEN